MTQGHDKILVELKRKGTYVCPWSSFRFNRFRLSQVLSLQQYPRLQLFGIIRMRPNVLQRCRHRETSSSIPIMK